MKEEAVMIRIATRSVAHSARPLAVSCTVTKTAAAVSANMRTNVVTLR
jgi:hypothetical protein